MRNDLDHYHRGIPIFYGWDGRARWGFISSSCDLDIESDGIAYRGFLDEAHAWIDDNHALAWEDSRDWRAQQNTAQEQDAAGLAAAWQELRP